MQTVLGRGAHLSAVPIDSPDGPNCSLPKDIPPPPKPPLHPKPSIDMFKDRTLPKNTRFREHPEVLNKFECSPVRNGCSSSRENLLAKTDVAMSSLLLRQDQVAVQCNMAQVHGGGRLMCEDKFQVNKNFNFLL